MGARLPAQGARALRGDRTLSRREAVQSRRAAPRIKAGKGHRSGRSSVAKPLRRPEATHQSCPCSSGTLGKTRLRGHRDESSPSRVLSGFLPRTACSRSRGKAAAPAGYHRRYGCEAAEPYQCGDIVGFQCVRDKLHSSMRNSSMVARPAGVSWAQIARRSEMDSPISKRPLSHR